MLDYLRPALEWLLWSRKRVFLLSATVLAVLIVAGQAIAMTARHNGGAGPPTPPPRPPAASAPAARPAPQGQPASARPARPAPAAAVSAGEDFTAAWAGHAAGWPAAADRYATPRLAAQLARTSPVMLPATRVTGPARVTGQAPGTVHLSVPTDAGPALVTVRFAGGRWLADSVMLARTGD